MNLRFNTPRRKNAVILLVLMLMLVFFASTPLHGSAADAGKGAQVINKAPSPVHIFRKLINGDDANSKPGPVIPQGTDITWTYYVENVGSASLSNIHITDDNGTPDYVDDDFTVCIIDKLNNNKSYTCSYTGTFQLGPYGNVATMTAEPPSGPVITDQDPAYYFGVTTGPSITILKFTNGLNADHAPGPEIIVGEAVTWTYQVYNTGDVLLTDLVVMDDNGTPGNTGDDYEVCTRTSLASLADFECTSNGTALPGQYRNLGSASGTYNTAQVTDEDESHYIGLGASIDLEKSTNGQDADNAPGPYITAGDPVTWEYIVSNDGRLSLSNVSVTDDQGLSVSCPQTELDVGEQMTCSASGTAAAGQYANLGTATGSPPGSLDDVSDTDPSHYFGAQSSITLEKHTNDIDADTAPGPYVFEGDTVTWTYTFTNTGNVALSNVTVMDDNGTPGEPGDDFPVCTNPIPLLAPDASDSCTASDTASAGQYANLGTATGTPPGGLAAVSDTDPSHYFGVIPQQEAIVLQKYTNGLDADTAPGPSIPAGQTVTWTYTFTNTGNVALSDVTVSDNNGTPGEPNDDFTVCTIPSLNPDASDSCTNIGTSAAGQYTNIGTVAGTPPGGLPDISDTDSSNYFGMQAAVNLEKSTNDVDADTAPGPSIPVGDTVTWTYTVTNTGNVALSDIIVTDDNGTPGDTSDDFTVCTILSLDPDASDTCSNTGSAAADQYTNIGSVAGTPAGGLPDVSDSDTSNYFGVIDQQPALALQKYTNGLDADTAPGPYVLVGETVTWTYNVTNTGNITLFDILVTDDNGTPGDPSDDFTVCSIASLDPDAVDTCSASGTSAAGQYANLGTASSTPTSDLPDVSDSDNSHYFGAQPVIAIEKLTNGQDADAEPGPSILVGDNVNWEYIIYNNGNVRLNNIKVIDDQIGSICTLDTLNAGVSNTCSSTGTAVPGQYTNVATVTATPPGGLNEVQGEDSSHYFGYEDGSAIEIQKSTNGFDADSAPGPALIVGYNVSWEFTITNRGGETITNITIIDDNGSPDDKSDDLTVCMLDILAPLDSHTCAIHGKVQHGQYANVGKVTGYINGKMVSASDPSHYLGKFPILYLSIIFRNGTNP